MFILNTCLLSAEIHTKCFRNYKLSPLSKKVERKREREKERKREREKERKREREKERKREREKERKRERG